MPLFLFLHYCLYFLITAVIAEIFSSTAELVIHIGIQTKEAKAEIGTHPVIAETKIKKSLV